MHWLRSWVARSPKRAVVIGKTLLLAGAVLVLGAVFARAGLMGINSDRAQAGQPPLRTLAQAYPQYPTWLVPEGPVGFALAAVLVLAGMGLTHVAEKQARERDGGF
jgi:hypothetical protein